MSRKKPVKTTFDAQELERQKIEALAEFAAGAGHEINNPLAIISGHAQMLLGQIDDPDLRRSLAMIQAQVNRAYEMIADIRLFARPPEPELQSFELNTLIEETIDRLKLELVERYGLEADSLDIHWMRPEKEAALLVHSDPVQISVALLAVLRNAVEALGLTIDAKQGKITISCEPDKIPRPGKTTLNAVAIHVQDDGPGIAEKNRPLLFSPYFSGRQAGRGLGFGLSKAWKILQICQGSLECSSYAAGNTIFTLRIPVGE